MKDTLTHFDNEGRPLMVDVSGKADSTRTATARGSVRFSEAAYDVIRRRGVKKGDILRTAELAGVMGAKRTADIIPLCHPLALTSAKVAASFNDENHSVEITAIVKAAGKTGVEMEALTAVSIACLTVYDMTKAIDKSMVMGAIELVEKTGGKSGDFKR